MLAIQDVGSEIFGNSPRKFYAMVGCEYGLKLRYIDMLVKQHGELKCVQEMSQLLDMLSVKHIIPLPPTVYLVRYDNNFISSLDAKTASKIASLKFQGTIVVIYDDEKASAKLDKFLPEYTVELGEISKQFIMKYLVSDFPTLSEKVIKLAALLGHDYYHAQLICDSLSHLPEDKLASMPEAEMRNIVNVDISSGDSMVKIGVASRDFSYLMTVLDKYPGTLDNFLYAMLSTLLELEKVIQYNQKTSDLYPYAKEWTLENIYNMFMHGYAEIKKTRTVGQDPINSIIYLASLLRFEQVPSVEEMM